MIEQLTERIEIKTITRTKQPNGEELESYSTIATVWADAVPLRGKESYEGDTKTAIESYRFIIRYRTDIDTTSLIEWNGKKYDIEFIQQYHKKGRNNFMLIETTHTTAK